MELRKSWRAVRPHLPGPVIDAVSAGYREYMRARCWYEGVSERSLVGDRPHGAVPPPFLRYRVDGSIHLDHFLAVGERVVADMEAALGTIGRDLASFGDVLDFGCGCGRVLRWLRGRVAPGARLNGTDIDRKAIAWCRAHLDYGTFAANEGLPPLGAADGAFDLVYAISVFTHLDADRQLAWSRELARVTRPGGIVLLTVHGPTCAAKFGREVRLQPGAEGFAFEQADSVRGVFPAWYQASYQTPENVRATFGASFAVLGHIPGGVGGFQDVVLLGKCGV